MDRRDRNENSYRRALKIALVVSVVAHVAILAFGRLRVNIWSDSDGPAIVLLPAEELPAESPLEVVELTDAAAPSGQETEQFESSAPISEAVETSAQSSGDADAAAAEAPTQVVFAMSESESLHSSTVFLTSVTSTQGPTMATDATIEDLLVKKRPAQAEGAGVDEDQWADTRSSGRRGTGIRIGIGGHGDGDTCKPHGTGIITTRIPLGTTIGRLQPRY